MATKTNYIDLDQEIDEVLSGANKKNNTQKKKKNKKKSDDGDGSIMSKLLKKNPLRLPTLGEKITGKVVAVDSLALYIDLEKFGSGIVYGKEIKDGFGQGRKKIAVGDEITATVINLENEDGYVELSVSEAIKEQAWNDLREKRDSKEVVTTKILDANKGGLMVDINGLPGFMPVSQLTAEHYPRVEDGDRNKILEILKSYIGEEMSVCILDIDDEEEKLIVSEKVAFQDRERKSIKELKKGDVIEGEVSGVVDFGAFVKFVPPSKKGSENEEDKLEGLVHISQLDWQLIDDPRKIIHVGDKIRAKIIAIDDTRISLSIRELKSDPWEKAGEKYKLGDIVKGTINKINHFGAFVYLDEDIHGLAHISSFPGYPKKPIEEVVKIGDKYYWEIMSLEPNDHRMGLKFIGEKKKKKDEAKKAEKKNEEKEDEKVKTQKDASADQSNEDSKQTKAKVKKETKAKKSTKKIVKKSVVKKGKEKITKKKTTKKSVKKETKKK